VDRVIDISRRTRKRQALHQTLLETARRLFAEYGVSRTTVDDIAEAADVARESWTRGIDVDQEAVVQANRRQNAQIYEGFDSTGAPWEHWGEAEWLRFGVESQNWMLSQFLHGEQGALVCTARVVETVPCTVNVNEG